MTIAFDPFYTRVAEVLGLGSQQELAVALGVNRSAVTQAKKRNSVPEKWLLVLAREYGLDPDWLETGQGSPRSGPDLGEEFKKVPKVQARLCAGGGSFEVEGNITDYYAFRWDWLNRRGNPDSMVLMDVMGNSMEPEIKEGDTLLIDQSQQDVFAGSIYAVGVEDTVLVKRVEKRPGALALISDNVEYSDLILAGDELETVRIIGKLVWISREYR
ncbi:MAG: helix-turn-helix transcriptional regulator [Desulfovibrio sp.]|nr:MAG: helix-turn-helix transcriptional regulator [Desulfovibrio sp.]